MLRNASKRWAKRPARYAPHPSCAHKRYRCGKSRAARSMALTVNLTRSDRILDRLGALSVNLATDAEGGAQDLLDDTLQGLGETLEAHGASDLDDLVQADRLVVLDVLLLLAVAGRLLEGADHEGGGGRDNRHGGLTVLDGELAGDAQTLLLVW